MKLFQKLLLAPAALGLFAPVVANANESNFRDVTNYTQGEIEVSVDTFKPLSNKNPLLAGGEGGSQSSSSDDFDVDSFSSTTTASFTTNFAVASIDGTAAVTQEAAMIFDWEIALSSSFTGNDSLDVVMHSGATGGLFAELDFTETVASKITGVKVDTVSYTNSVSDRVTAFFASGNGTVGSALYNTACVYGGVVTTFGDCGVSAANIDEGFGTAVGANFDFENGLSFSLGYEGQGMASGEVGILSENGRDAGGLQLAYSGDSYGVSVSFANIDNATSGQTQSTGVNAYFAPSQENVPSVSVGFETNHDNSVLSTETDETSHYFVGIQWDEFGNGSLGAAIGSKTPTAENGSALSMYEVFYSYNYADGINVTPFYYSKDNAGAVAETGIGVKTTFSF